MKRLSSWVGVFSEEIFPLTVEDQTQLVDDMSKGNYYSIGKSHSYNGIQLSPSSRTFIFSESSLKEIVYDDMTAYVEVEASVTIKQLKLFLLQKGRRLANSGSFMEQTIIGALVTGTHGYGENAIMADSIEAVVILNKKGQEIRFDKSDEDFAYIGVSFGVINPIVRVTLSTLPVEQFEITNTICGFKNKNAYTEDAVGVAYALFPYSGNDPTIALTVQRKVDHEMPVTPIPVDSRIGFAFRYFFIRYYWFFNLYFPSLRPWLQKRMRALEGKVKKVVYTDKNDIDYLYDPYPLIEAEKPPRFERQLFNNAYSSYNLAFFAPQKIVDRVLYFIVDVAAELKTHGFYLKNYIGVRELKRTSKFIFAGNHKEEMSAIDLFSSPQDFTWLIEIQRRVLSNFGGIRPHWAKSILTSEYRKSFSDAEISHLTALSHRLYDNYMLTLPQIVKNFLSLR